MATLNCLKLSTQGHPNVPVFLLLITTPLFQHLQRDPTSAGPGPPTPPLPDPQHPWQEPHRNGFSRTQLGFTLNSLSSWKSRYLLFCPLKSYTSFKDQVKHKRSSLLQWILTAFPPSFTATSHSIFLFFVCLPLYLKCSRSR